MQDNQALRMAGPAIDNDVDVMALIRMLWDQKALVFSTMAALFLAAVSYAFLATPYYEARVGVLPPNVSDIAGYNLGRTEAAGLKPLTVHDVYNVFLRSLDSESLKRNFFEEFYIPAEEGRDKLPRDVLWDQFNGILSITSIKARPEYREVRIGGEDPHVASSWLERFLSMAAASAEEAMRLNVASEIETQVKSIEHRIGVLRDTVRQRREDRIAVLKEALEVAESVGLKDPQGTMWQTFSTSNPSAAFDGSPLYLRGAKAIRAEFEVLLQRKSDDPFIPELRPLQERLQFLKGMEVGHRDVRVFSQDGPIRIPDTPIKPKKMLILALGLVLGGMVGIFVALVRGFWRGGAAF